MEGAYALAVVHEEEPDCLIVAREGSPLMLGVGEQGHYAASDASALLSVTRRIIYLENGDLGRLTREAIELVDGQGQPMEREVVTSSLLADAVELGDYRHYMQKEIFEQPQALGNTLEMLGGAGRLQPGIFGADAEAIFAEVDSVLILACGTSSYAGMTARYWIESGGESHLQRVGVRHRARDGAALYHPGEPGDRRGLHQGLYHPAGRALPADPAAGQGQGSPGE